MSDPPASMMPADHRTSSEELDELMQVTSPRAWIALVGCALLLAAAFAWSLLGTVTDTVDAQGVLLAQSGLDPLAAPCAGVVTKFEVRSGDEVGINQLLALVTPAGGHQPEPVKSPFPCRIVSRIVPERATVNNGAPLLLIERRDAPLVARLYVPINAGYAVTDGLDVQVSPVSVNPSEFGMMTGKVASAGKFPITQEGMLERLHNADLAQSLSVGGPKLQILVALTGADGKSTSAPPKANAADWRTTDAYHWSASAGPKRPLYSGTPCQGRIVVVKHAPISLVFPSLANHFPSLRRN